MQNSGKQSLYDFVTAARKGNEKAFEKLCEMQCARIIYTCMGLLGNREDAEDAAQEVLVRMHKNIRRLKATEAYSAWLSRIVLSVCNNMRRDNLKHKSDLPIDEMEGLYANDLLPFLPSAYVENQEGRRQLLNVVAKLPYQQRVCIYLFYYEGLRHKEIADALSITTRAVESHILRAKSNIKKQLTPVNEAASAAGMLEFSAALAAVFKTDAASTITPAQVADCIKGAKPSTAPGVFAKLANNAAMQNVAIAAVTLLGCGILIALTPLFSPNALFAKLAAVPPGPQSSAEHVLDTDLAMSPGLASDPSAAAAFDADAAEGDIAASLRANIVFDGGLGANAHVNPKAILLQESGDPAASVTWTITNSRDETVASGKGTKVEEELAALEETGADGMYTVHFQLENAGQTFSGTAEFRIYSGNIQPGMFG